MLQKLIKAARLHDDADKASLADTIWLAMCMATPNPAHTGADAAPPGSHPPPVSQPAPAPADAAKPATTAANQADDMARNDDGQTPITAGRPKDAAHKNDPSKQKWIGTLPTLPDKPQFRQALRVFRSHGPQSSSEIDETETAEQYARQGGGHLVPVMQKGARRWLKISLLAETGGSNALWTQALDELEGILRQQGSFRAVNRKALTADAPACNWWKNEIVIVASDFTSDSWWDGIYPQLLRKWSITQPLLLMHTLPARLWARSWTGVPDALATASTAAQPTQALQIALDPAQLEFESPPSRLACPLIGMEPTTFGNWSSALMQSWATRMPAILFALRNAPAPAFLDADDAEEAAPPRSPEETIMAFKMTASPLARKLAQYMAVTAPLNFPVMRWVQHAMLPESDCSHLAEFVLGGLLERVEGDADTEADCVRYDFADGVRALLQLGMPISHGMEVLQIVGAYLEAHDDSGLKLRTAVETLDESGFQALSGELKAFALVSAEFMRHLGLADGGLHFGRGGGSKGDRGRNDALALKMPDQDGHFEASTTRESDGAIGEAPAQPLNRVRAIFLGHGGAGKTSLIRVLHDEPVIAGVESMTPGIDIREWSLPASDIKADFWDFGGQVMAHATHQLFLRESCLYVLVISARSETNATEQAEYWLEQVKAFGKSSAVMIVGNKADQAAVHFDMEVLKQKYPNIVGFFPLSCTQAQGAFSANVQTFRQEFCRQLGTLTTHRELFTKGQFAVLQSLRALTPKAAFLGELDFVDLCIKHGVAEQGQNRLLDVADTLGVIVDFPQLPFMEGFILNPRWLTYGVYTLMVAQQARLNAKDIIRILSKEKVVDEMGNTLMYPSEKCRLIMDAMRAFKLSYLLPGQADSILIPALLPASQPTFDFDKTQALAFSFDFAMFLPRHIMPELIVQRHPEIEDQMVWRDGVLLAHRTLQARALLQVDYRARCLLLWVAGADANAYLSVLVGDVGVILGRLDIAYDEWITLPKTALLKADRTGRGAEERASYRQLLAYNARGITEFITDSGVAFDVRKVLRLVGSTVAHARMSVAAMAHGNTNLAWASASGEDAIGKWAEISVNNVVQRLRWVPPGNFLMGSPDSEAGRFSSEGPRHRVTISQGLWLADTACTQALWQAVTGDNPSHFNKSNRGGPQHPVEMVSWDMIQPFLRAMTEKLPGCQITLPTEAEWEYACRAGSTTAFSFGETIGTDQINFNGNFPCGKGVKGEYRERTLPVKELAANGWGLYQMHGNVWEWCADGLRAYEDKAVADPGWSDVAKPQGVGGAARALRGGSWYGSALYARSACRLDGQPDGRGYDVGLRVACRSSS